MGLVLAGHVGANEGSDLFGGFLGERMIGPTSGSGEE
jgi:hypothetical protein